ncbi:MAG: hypothetical protein IKA10_02455 [Oscillospiraceae bacterium]|nr:hypothetical protein [Oscillospiraceae bacterium]
MNNRILKRMASVLLSIAVITVMMPISVLTAFAEETVTVTTYDELWSAIYSKEDCYITLGNNITYEVPDGGNSPLSAWQFLLNVGETKNKIVDLNGYTLRVSNNKTQWTTQSGLFTIDDTANLIVMNGTIELFNYNNSQRTDKGVFNARGGNLTLTNVNVRNGRNGTTVNAMGDATVVIEGGTITANNGFAVTATGNSWLVLDKGVTLTTTTGSGLITQPADAGYGSLHAETQNLSIVSAIFEAGIEVNESTISQFSPSANRLVFVEGKQYNSAFATNKSGDYCWVTDATGGCVLVVNDIGYSFAKNVNIISTTATQLVSVTNGTAFPKQASYGAEVTITADNIPGKIFDGWTVLSGNVTLKDYSAQTTTFTMGAKAVKIKAAYQNIPVKSAEFSVKTPVAGEQMSAATTTTEHITVNETWCVEIYNDDSFSLVLPANHTFEGGHRYRIGVNFELEQDYSLDDNFYVNFVDQSTGTSTSATQGATLCDWFVDYTVEDNSVEITTVTATITGVKAGAAIGSTKVTTDDTTYTVSIKDWYDCDDVFSYDSATVLQASDTFVGGKTYTVRVAFIPVGNNTLANKLSAYINGEQGNIGSWDAYGRDYFVTITVPETQPNEYMVSYHGNGGSGTMIGDMVTENGTFTLKECTFKAPEGKQFKAWAIGSVNGEQKQPGEQITITAETYIYAIWKEIIEYPINVKATNDAATGKPVISWRKVNGAAKYQVWRSTTGKAGSFTLLVTTTATSQINKNAVAGKLYYYKVVAVDANGNKSDASAIVSRTADLPKVTGVKATNDAATGKPVISWDKVDGATSYKVMRSTAQNGTYTVMNTVKTTSMTNKNAVAGNTYFYKVMAVHSNTNANSAHSAIVKTVCDLPQVTGVKAVNDAATGKPKISWDKVDGAAKYQVWRSTTGKAGSFTLLVTTTATSQINKNAVAGKLYYYKVVAVHSNTNANSAYSAIVQRTADLARPTVTVKIGATGKPVLSWNKVEGAVKYQIYRSKTGEAGSFGLINTVTTTSTTNKNAVAGTKYYYKVVAVHSNTNANSAYSTVVSITSK